jgi:hypothetical protein
MSATAQIRPTEQWAGSSRRPETAGFETHLDAYECEDGPVRDRVNNARTHYHKHKDAEHRFARVLAVLGAVAVAAGPGGSALAESQTPQPVNPPSLVVEEARLERSREEQNEPEAPDAAKGDPDPAEAQPEILVDNPGAIRDLSRQVGDVASTFAQTLDDKAKRPGSRDETRQDVPGLEDQPRKRSLPPGTP